MSKVQLAPRDELKALRHFAEQIERDYNQLMDAYLVLDGALNAIVASRDIVNQIGTQATMNRVYEMIEMTLDHAARVDLIDKWADDLGSSIYCQSCCSRLSEASEAAGMCLKCHEGL